MPEIISIQKLKSFRKLWVVEKKLRRNEYKNCRFQISDLVNWDALQSKIYENYETFSHAIKLALLQNIKN